MSSMPTNAVEALSFLLQQWVDTAFSMQYRDVSALNHLWISLAEALCSSHKPKLEAFQQNIAQLRPTKRAGDPPVHALEHRIYELIDAGLHEHFLVIAIRQSMEQLILIEFPSTIDQWRQLANDILPLEIQFARKSDEMPGPSTIIRPE